MHISSVIVIITFSLVCLRTKHHSNRWMMREWCGLCLDLCPCVIHFLGGGGQRWSEDDHLLWYLRPGGEEQSCIFQVQDSHHEHLTQSHRWDLMSLSLWLLGPEAGDTGGIIKNSINNHANSACNHTMWDFSSKSCFACVVQSSCTRWPHTTMEWSTSFLWGHTVNIKTGVINLSEPGQGHISITSYRKVSDSHWSLKDFKNKDHKH